MNHFELDDDRPLPTGWICRQSKSRSRPYYFNTASGESSWRHPLDIEESTEASKRLTKRSAQDDGSVPSAKKTKSSKKKHKVKNSASPSKSDTSKGSKSSSMYSSKNNFHNKSPPAMKAPTVDANGQPRLVSNSKVSRISAWVDSVDNSYAPSEPGTSVSTVLPLSPEDSSEFFHCAEDLATLVKCGHSEAASTANSRQSTNLVSRQHGTNGVGNEKQNVSPAMKTSFQKCLHSTQGDGRKDILKGFQQNCTGSGQTAGSSGLDVQTCFSPTSPKPTFPGHNLFKTDFNQHFPPSLVNSVFQSQATEDEQMDSQGFSLGLEKEGQEVQSDRTKLTGDNKEMAMDIDNYEELEDQIKLELQEIRSEFVINPAKVSSEPEKNSPVLYTDTLYLVLDTNVLLSHLKLISELKDFPIEGVVRPVLVVPWIVMQELDSLKSDAWKIKKGKLVTSSDENGQCGVGALARSAVRFLHLCFESGHPRVRGQTASQASEMLSSDSIENPSNDDRILQCCLHFQRKAENGHAVLFSNDQNLCSKAIINGVKAFTHKSLVRGLKELFQSTAVVLKKDNFKDYYNELKIQETLAEKRAKADDLACELQCVLREGLAVVVEAEMRAAYEDLWDKVVYIKPPWTLADLLQLLNKHWIAVFGHVWKREIKKTVDELQKHFGVDKGSPGCLSNTAVMLDQAHTLFEAITARSSYNGAGTKCLTAIIVLQRKCKECRSEGCQQQTNTIQNPVVMGPPQIPALVGPDVKNSSRSSSSEVEPESFSERFEDVSEVGSVPEINTAQAANPHGLVLSTFETIWNAVTQFSAQIFSGVGFPHPVPISFLENLPKPTKAEAIQFLGRLCTCLACVVTAIQGVLQEPKGGETGNPQLFENLLRAISQFFEQILFMNTGVTSSDLRRFARDPDARLGLIQGCSQLDRALATLQQCSTWVVSCEQ